MPKAALAVLRETRCGSKDSQVPEEAGYKVGQDLSVRKGSRRGLRPLLREGTRHHRAEAGCWAESRVEPRPGDAGARNPASDRTKEAPNGC